MQEFSNGRCTKQALQIHMSKRLKEAVYVELLIGIRSTVPFKTNCHSLLVIYCQTVRISNCEWQRGLSDHNLNGNAVLTTISKSEMYWWESSWSIGGGSFGPLYNTYFFVLPSHHTAYGTLFVYDLVVLKRIDWAAVKILKNEVWLEGATQSRCSAQLSVRLVRSIPIWHCL